MRHIVSSVFFVVLFRVKLELIDELIYVEETLQITESIIGLDLRNGCSDASLAASYHASGIEQKLSGLVVAVGLTALIGAYKIVKIYSEEIKLTSVVHGGQLLEEKLYSVGNVFVGDYLVAVLVGADV